MQCSHCLADATPTGEHMSVATFVETVAFVERTGFPVMMLSGGEPTEHPNLEEFLDLLQSVGIKAILLSNGMFLSEDPERWDRLLELVDGVQVTNDPRYYPLKIARFEHPKVTFETELRHISPFGRSVKKGIEPSRFSPLCFNLRSLTRTLGGFSETLYYLRSRGKMCIPSVNIDGTLVAGESPACTTIGSVRDDFEMLSSNLRRMTCDCCGLVKNLTQEQKLAIGEACILLA